MTPNRFSARFVAEMWRNPMRAMRTAAETDSPFARVEVGPFRCFILTDPEIAARALNGSGLLFRRTPDLAFWFQPAGQGVASSPHEKWVRQRRLLAPFFKASAEADLSRITASESDRLCETIAGRKDAFDLQAEVMETTLRIAVQHLLVRPFPGDSAPVCAAIQTAMHHATPVKAIRYRFLSLVNRGLARRLRHLAPEREALQVLHGFIDRIIDTARERPQDRAPLLNALMEADAAGELDPGELRDQVATFLVAAVDSVGSAIVWTLWQLAQRPDAAGKAASSDLWAEASVLESMRLVPPLWMYRRDIQEEHELAGQAFRKGDILLFVPYVVHMRSEYWPNPDAFDPSRFVDEGAIRGDTDFSYMPFGHGPHACLGRRMAMAESRTVVRTLLRRFELRLDEQTRRNGADPAKIRVAVLMKGGLWVQAEARHESAY